MADVSTQQARRIAVIGAGPIGLEAALYAASLGHNVQVYERGDLAQAVSTWRHVTLFSPWRMNTSSLGLRVLQQAGCALRLSDSDWDRCPTGAALIEKYLLPLSQTPLLRGCLQTQQRVVSIGRPWLLKGELIGKASRSEHGFRLLLEAQSDSLSPGSEQIAQADVVLDCSGTFFHPNPIGQGGIWAQGERSVSSRVWHHVPDVLGRDRDRFFGRRVLIVGGGHSAATAAVLLAELLQQPDQGDTQVFWAHRDAATQPYPADALAGGDPLPERHRLHVAANDVVKRPGMQYLPSTVVSSMRPTSDGAIAVRLQSAPQRQASSAPQAAIGTAPQDPGHELVVDEVLGLTGYGPDRSIYEQLQVHECYASLGPMKLAALLLGASGDCLAQPTPGPETLRNPEPQFFILGAKSYGRNSAFLLQTGHAQIRSVFQLVEGKPDLDLYAVGSAQAHGGQ